MTAQSVYSSKKGFTLIELMITIAIIAVLATIGAVMYGTVQRSARISKRIQDLDALKIAIETYKSANGFYPKATGGQCIGSAVATSLGAATPSFTTYMQSIPKDPSSVDNVTEPCYHYKSDANGLEYKVWTGTIPASEMDPARGDANTFASQPNYLDPARDGTTANCVIDPPATGNTYSAWAVYSSLGTATTNACAF